MKIFLLMSAILIAQLSFAGDDKGNGGDVVLCTDKDGVQSAEMLDTYESREFYGFNPDFGPDTSDHMKIVEYLLKKKQKLLPFRYEYWGEFAKSFHDEALYLPNVDLVDIRDSQHIVVPKNCKIKQVAIQKDPENKRSKRYTINKDLWNLLSEENKAVLILHEIIYREAINYNHSNSKNVRYLVSLILANEEIEEFSSVRAVNELLMESNFVYGEAYGCLLPFERMEFKDDYVSVIKKENDKIDNEKFPRPKLSDRLLEQKKFWNSKAFQTSFGTIQFSCEAELTRLEKFDGEVQLTDTSLVATGLDPYKKYIESKTFEFYGLLQDVALQNSPEYLDGKMEGNLVDVILKVQGQSIKFFRTGRTFRDQYGREYERQGKDVLNYDKNGNIESIYFGAIYKSSEFELKGVDGKTYILNKDNSSTSTIKFNKDGLVRSCSGICRVKK